MRAPLAALLALLPLAAGCAGPGPDGPGAGPEAPAVPAGDGLGSVRGVAVDDAVRPLAGVRVVLGAGLADATTDAGGRFAFSGVEPGLQLLRAEKPGYAAAQATVEVAAGEGEGRTVTVLMQRLAGAEPRVVALHWSGFLQCSWTVAGAFATGCLLSPVTDDDSRRFSGVDGVPSFLQSETLWKPTQALGTGLCMRQYASRGVGGEELVPILCGESPLVQRVPGERLAELGLGRDMGLERIVWVDGYMGHENPGLAVNQRFDMFTHLFYNAVPDEGWRFHKDGSYPLS